jgi:hypothetical protein
MAKSIVFYIIRYYGNDEKIGMQDIDTYGENIIFFALIYGVKFSKSGAKSCVEMIRYYTKWWGGSVNELVRGHS